MRLKRKETDYLFQNLIRGLKFNEWEPGEEERYHRVMNENHREPQIESENLSFYLNRIKRYNEKYSNELYKERKRILEDQ